MVASIASAACSAPKLPQGQPVQTTVTSTTVPVTTTTAPPPVTESVVTSAPAAPDAAPTTRSASSGTAPAGCADEVVAVDQDARSAMVVPGPWPRPYARAVSLSEVSADTAGRTLHLGFDVEGDPAPLNELLDVLDAHGVATTFFVQGEWVAANAESLQEIVARGHELGNHAYGPEPLGSASGDRIVDELTRTEDLVTWITSESTKPFFRPPNGDRTERSVEIAARAGWTTIHWTGGANDFVGGVTVIEMCDWLLYATRPGAILLAHTFNPEIPDVVDRWLDRVEQLGMVVVPLSVLLSDDPESFLVSDRRAE